MMRIVVLDDTLCRRCGTGVAELESMGDVMIWPATAPDEVPERCAGYDFVLTCSTVLTAGMIRAMEDVRYIGVMGPFDGQADLWEAMRAGITVTAVPVTDAGAECDGDAYALRVIRAAIGNLMAYLGGAPRNVVLP